jgi:hypothetical protein
MRQHRPARDKDSLDIDPQHCLQGIKRHLQGRPGPGDAGVVDEEVDLIEAGESGVDSALDGLGRGHIGYDRESAGLRRNRPRSGIVAVEHDHRHPLARQPLRYLAPDPAAAAGD